MEEVDLLRNALFNQPTVRVGLDQRLRLSEQIVDDEQRRLDFPVSGDG